MDRERLMKILQEVQQGRLSLEQAVEQFVLWPLRSKASTITTNPELNLDFQRELRCGIPEVVFGEGKTPKQVADAAHGLAQTHHRVLVTRANPEQFAALREVIPKADFFEAARCILWRSKAEPEVPCRVSVVAAGTSDVPVAEETCVTLDFLGIGFERIYDVGVAGLHRLTREIPRLRQADVLIVCAGMEGALPSVTAGAVAAPVIAVPTSIGYGASFGGLTALLAMLNSCANGVGVVNIDNGFGAACLAHRILAAQDKE